MSAAVPVSLNVLLVEDNPADAELVLRALAKGGYAPICRRVETEADFLEALALRPEIVISDFSMPQFSGLRALELAQAGGLRIPLIIVSGTIGEETAVEAMRKGAADYLLKDRLTRLGLAVAQALARTRLVAERETAARELDAAEGKYRRLFDNLDEGIYQTSADGRLVTANASLARLAGYASPEEMIADTKNIAEQFYADPADRARFQRMMETTGRVVGFETQMRHRDGTLGWITATARAVRDPDGNLTYEGVLRDISQQKEAEEALRQSEQRFRSTLENLIEGCQIVDPTWQYLYVNTMAARHSGCTVGDLMGRRVTEVFPEFATTLTFAMMQQCMNDRTARQTEFEFKYENGSTAWFDLVIQPVPEGLFLLSLDITERKHAEERIQGQISELQRWHNVTLGREERIMSLKREVNQLLERAGEPCRYNGDQL